MIPERPLEVLRAIVEDFVTSNQPVGSKSLLERHPLGVSAATIRNDMALLEDENLITAPHTSSGRIPTQKGYRLFVDQLAKVKPLSSAEKTAIESFLEAANDLDETVERSARALANLTNSLAVVQYPSLGRSAIRHIELIRLAEDRVLLMLISDSGRMQQSLIDGKYSVSEEVVQEMRARLNAKLAASQLTDVKVKLENFKSEFAAADQNFAAAAIAVLLSLVDANKQEKIVLSGASNLVKKDQDFYGELSKVLELIEEQVVLLKLIDELHAEQHGVGLRIGSELGLAGVDSAALMVTGYESHGTEVAKLGVLGPTRMDYSANIAAVRAVARYLTKIFGD